MVVAVIAAVGTSALVRTLLLGILVDGRHGGEKLLRNTMAIRTVASLFIVMLSINSVLVDVHSFIGCHLLMSWLCVAATLNEVHNPGRLFIDFLGLTCVRGGNIRPF